MERIWTCVDCGLEKKVPWTPSKVARIKRCWPCSRRFVSKLQSYGTVSITCAYCGKDRVYKKSDMRGRSGMFCSLLCANRHRSNPVVWTCQMCGETKELVRHVAKKLRFCRACANKHHAEQMKGQVPYEMMDEAGRKRWLATLRTKEHREKMSRVLAGVPHKGPRGARGSPQHTKARHFTVSSPSRRIYSIHGIQNFVRAHPWLFKKADVKWKPNNKHGSSFTCRASFGLGSLVRKANTRGTWKGWTLVEQLDEK